MIAGAARRRRAVPKEFGLRTAMLLRSPALRLKPFLRLAGAALVALASLTASYAQPDREVPLTPIYASSADLTNIAFIPGTSDVAVIEKGGKILRVPLGGGEPSLFLDLASRLKSKIISEQGLLGVAFQPDFEASGIFYAAYTNRYNQWILSRFTLAAGAPLPAAREEVLLQVDRYAPWHACGSIAFHPIDGYLYACIGDSDAQGDPNGTASNLELLNGKILRLDVTHQAVGYSIPKDNPYVGSENARPEIWMSGLRNPWQFSFDAKTGDYFIPDVGRAAAEEIDYLQFAAGAGADFGWPKFEGGVPAHPHRACESSACASTPPVAPIFSYGHADGSCAVIGGAVYRGADFPEAQGAYFFSDFCTAVLWALRLRSGVWERGEFGYLATTPVGIKAAPDGSLYVVGLDGVFRLDLTAPPTERWTPYRAAETSGLAFAAFGDIADLLARGGDRTLILAAQDEASAGLSRATIDALDALGLHLGDLKYRGSYAAVISGGKLIAEQVNNSGSVTLDSPELRALGVGRVYSAGFLFGNSSEIIVNGVDYSAHRRGMNLVVLEGSKIRTGAIDTNVGEMASP
jgi:glucose/arabinose dehydrogenase